MSESYEQITYFDYVRWRRNMADGDDWWSIWHAANGGKRPKRTAAILKRQGVLAGVYDIQIAVARNGYHGAFIEMKYKYNKLTDNQKAFKERQEKQGYLCVEFWNAQDAIDFTEAYLDGNKEVENER